MTSDILKRVWEHKNEVAEGFTKKYRVHILVHAEFHDTMEAAILREKQMKKWNRAWKLTLIERTNPDWQDLYPELAK